MSWFDLILMLAFAALTALGAQRKIMGLVVGLGGAIVFRPLLILLNGNIYLALAFAFAAGLLLGLASRFLLMKRIGNKSPFQFLGALGGALLASLMILTMVTSLPLGRDVNGLIIYPASNGMPASLGAAVRQSRLVKVGRDILLYPLLAQDANFVAQQGSGMYKNLHSFLVVKKPWERTTN